MSDPCSHNRSKQLDSNEKKGNCPDCPGQLKGNGHDAETVQLGPAGRFPRAIFLVPLFSTETKPAEATACQ